MDRRLLPYVTFLQENGAAPFAEYILCREAARKRGGIRSRLCVGDALSAL